MKSLATENIPQELKDRRQWVVWRFEKKGEDFTKVPYCAHNPGRMASVTDPNTWSTFDQAVNVAQSHSFAGIGYVFSSDDPYTGVDLDHCVTSGQIDASAQAVVKRLNSYAELSQSGTGVHIIVRARLPLGGRRKGHVEMYDSERYFCMTGRHLEGTPDTIEARQGELGALHAEIFGKEESASAQTVTPRQSNNLADAEIIQRAMGAQNGQKFKRLWEGNTTDYNSPSEATAALLRMLAFWTGADPMRLDSLFRQSGLMREKWDESRGTDTWGSLEVKQAIEHTSEVYQPKAGNTVNNSTHMYDRMGQTSPEAKRDKNGTASGTTSLQREAAELSRFEGLSKRVKDWVSGTTGWWATEELDRELGLSDHKAKENRRKILLRLKADGILEGHPTINKQFRFVNVRVTRLDFKSATTSGVLPVKWPLGIEKMVNLFAGNLVVVAGAPNAGKTALLLNFIYLNQDRFPISYFCSEMGADELRDRLDKFPGMAVEDWKFEAIERASDFADVIKPDCVNIIDYLEMTTELYLVNTHLTAISHKLGGGLAIVALQKKQGATFGRGQEFGLEKPRLYLSLDKGRMQIVKGKSWANRNVDPNGLQMNFRITDGCQFQPSGEWERKT